MALSSELERAQELLNSEDKYIDDISEKVEVRETMDDFIISLIKTNICSTIGIKYELGIVYITCVYPTGTKLKTFDSDKNSYLDFCERVFKIDNNEKYNCSRNVILDGVRTRVFCLMPPFCLTPNITISTTKQPPTTLNKTTISDEMWDKIVHSNFVILGQTGSGKTYLFNYLLSKFIRPDERIAIVEEFGELIPPNELTNSIIVPPPKPGEDRLLDYVTEMTNIMRLDSMFVGEIKGKEAWSMINNMSSGIKAGFTMHGSSARHGLNRLRSLCRLSCSSDEAIDDFIAKSINYIIYMENKQIKGIYELKGTHINGNFAIEEIGS